MQNAKRNFEVARDAVSTAVLKSILDPLRAAGLPAPSSVLDLYYAQPNARQAARTYSRLAEALTDEGDRKRVSGVVAAAVEAARVYNEARDTAPAKAPRTLAADSGRYQFSTEPTGPVDLTTAAPGTYFLVRYGHGTQLAVLTHNNNSSPFRRAQILRLNGRGNRYAVWSAPTYINKRDARILGRSERAPGDPVPSI